MSSPAFDRLRIDAAAMDSAERTRPAADPALEAQWIDEASRRLAAFGRGEIEAIAADDLDSALAILRAR